MIQYLLNLGIVLDRLFNTLLLGHPSQTFSQRLGRAQKVNNENLKWAWVSVDVIAEVLAGEKNHCLNSLTGKSMGKELWNLGGDPSMVDVED